MINYWPNKQSVKLNNIIVDLFLETENKLIYNLSNKTNYYLYTDILNNVYKNKLFNIILKELKKLVLDIIELNLNKINLKNLNYQILYIFIEKICSNFANTTNTEYNYKNLLVNIKSNILIENLLIYLILGSSYTNKNLFTFDQNYTPYKHVQILFENFIVQVSNIVIQSLLKKIEISSGIDILLNSKQICNKSYTSSRSIILFFNNLKWQSLIDYYLNEPKCIYNERNKVYLISSRGIIIKYIYITRIREIKKLQRIKIFFLLWLEIKDIVIPKIEKLIIQIGQYLIYLSISLFNNITILVIRIIVFYLKNKSL
uniref:Uncharacterized protein n=1 Tax=Bostrychia simpliciuscula TaxID=324754 RepID=A0A1Z1M7D3_9FLOR|nr:hypothetical protein [Bostrychia simpliciuscula]ARW61998.1 hypothetical protein [Bostrychia simpliciuscula]